MAGWLPCLVRGGKSGLHGETVPGNSRRGQPQGQRHREQTAPDGARVKRRGKSSPRDWQQDRHGKPHREQRQIGGPAGFGPGALRPGSRVDGARPWATMVPDEWPSPASVGTEPGLQAIRISACIARRPVQAKEVLRPVDYPHFAAGGRGVSHRRAACCTGKRTPKASSPRTSSAISSSPSSSTAIAPAGSG